MQVWAITYDPNEFTDEVRIKYSTLTLYTKQLLTASSMTRACYLWILNLKLASRGSIAGRMHVVSLINIHKTMAQI